MEIFGRNRNSDQRFLICVILLFLITSLYHIYAGMDFFRSTGIFPESLVDDYDMYERIFSASKDVLKDSPLANKPDITTQAASGGFVTQPGEEAYAYMILLFDRSFLGNKVLTGIMQASQMFLPIIGILLIRRNFLFPKVQSPMLRLIWSGLVIIFVTFILNFVFGLVFANGLYSLNIQGGAVEELITKLKGSYELWTPDFRYYGLAVLGTLVHMISYFSYGIFLGTITKDETFNMVLFLFSTVFVYKFLIMFPISTLYCSHRIISKLIFVALGGPVVFYDFAYWNVILFIIFLAAIFWWSAYMLSKRKSKPAGMQ